MNGGLLWFDDNPRKRLEDKVLKAAMHYERKYGYRPDVCLVHPSALNGNGNGKGNGNGNGKSKHAGNIEIRPGRSILPDHLWVGLEEHRREAKVASI